MLRRLRPLLALFPAILLGLASPGRADTYVFSSSIENTAVPVTLSLEDVTGGTQVQVSIPPVAGDDLIGVFGSVTSEPLLNGLGVSAAEGQVNQWQIGPPDKVWRVGADNGMLPVNTFDWGVRLGNSIVSSATFTLTGVTAAQIRDASTQGWVFGVRLQTSSTRPDGAKVGMPVGAPTIAIATPAGGAVVGSPVAVSGTFTGAGVSVSVNGVAATLNGNTWSASVPLTDGAQTITAAAANASGSAGTSRGVNVDGTGPVVTIATPAQGALTNQGSVTVSGTVTDASAVTEVSIDGQSFPVTAGAFSGVAALAEGANTISVSALDTFANSGSATVSVTLDSTPPAVVITAPPNGTIAASPLALVEGTVSDASAIASLDVNGVAATLGAGSFSASVTLAQGGNTVTATATDAAGNTGAASITVHVGAAPTLTITSPASGLLTMQSAVAVEVDASGASAVDVNGVAASANGGTWTATVPLAEGANTLTATATNAFGSAQAQVSVTRDSTPPVVTITVPPNGSVYTSQPIGVFGSVADASPIASLRVNGTAIAAGSSFAHTLSLAVGPNTITVSATDAAGNTGEATATVSFEGLTVAITSPADFATTSASAITISGQVNDAGASVTVNGVAAQLTGTSFSASVSLANGTNAITALATAGAVAASDAITVIRAANPPPPPPPDPVATPIDPSVPTDPVASLAFLYTGPNAVQTGVSAAFDPLRAGAIRGRVLTRSGAPLPSVTVKVMGHPEYGQTVTRADGYYDLAVNGGETFKLSIDREGFVTVFRNAQPGWRDTDVVDDIVMVPREATATAVDAASAAAFQVVRGRVESDALHTRQGTLLFPQGTTATAHLPSGTTQTLSAYTVRVTELTVGDTALNALPAELPPGPDPTNVWDLSVDEAEALGATRVSFNNTVPLYVEATGAFSPGDVAPFAALDPVTGKYQGQPSGVVLEVLSENGGAAELDTNGDSAPDTAAELAVHGITAAEQAQLSALYDPGQVLRRYRVQHFSGACGHALAFPRGARSPNQKPAQGQPPDCDCKTGSVLRVAQQVWGESVEVVDAAERLHYESGRTPGYLISNTLRIPITDVAPPASLEKVGLTIELAGRRFTHEFAPTAKQTYAFTWDGFDAYGRKPQGWQLARIAIDYFYYGFTDGRRSLLAMRQAYETRIGTWDARGAGIGGWTLSSHHAYDPYSSTLFRGDGRVVNGGELPVVLRRRSPATAQAPAILQFAAPTVAAAPDGTFYIAYLGPRTILYRIDPVTRTLVQIATLPAGATASDLVVGPDGAIYVASSGSHQVLRVTTAGVSSVFAGTTAGFSGDGGAATSAQLRNPNGLAWGPDGALYISDQSNHRIRRVRPDGIIETFAGNGTANSTNGIPGPAKSATISTPLSLTFGPDGSLYVGLIFRVARINPTGYVELFAGNGAGFLPPGVTSVGEGVAATSAYLSWPTGLAFGNDGALYIGSGSSYAGANRLRRVGPDGLIYTVAGTGTYPGNAPPGSFDDGRIARAAPILPLDVTKLPDGRILFLDFVGRWPWTLEPPLPGFTLGDISVASEEGGELYRFDLNGRHLDTRDTRPGAVLRTFAYTPAGQLDTITDADGNVTRVLRNAAGEATGIQGPYGQVTALGLDANGFLRTIVNPNGETITATASALGLVTSLARPGGAGVTVQYDAAGGLARETNLGGGFTAFSGAQTDSQRSVATQTALGVTDGVTVTYEANGDVTDARTGADGLVTTIVKAPTGTETTTSPDATVVARTERPDPRLGLAAPIAASLAITTPGGLSFLRTQSRTVTTDATTGALLTQTDAIAVNGRASSVAYDAATGITTTTTPAGRQLFDQIDGRGRLVATQVDGLEAVGLGYDGRGRLGSLVQGIGASQRLVSFGYDALGNLASVTDPLLRTVAFQYDLAGRVTRQVLPDARFIDFTYDGRGNLTSLTPPGQPAHVFRYTLRDEEAEYEPPDVVPGDPRTFFTYDLDRRLTRVDRPDGQAIVLGYDTAGRLATVTTPRGTTTQTYSAATGNVATLVAPGGEALAHSYDGSLLTATAWNGTVTGSVSQGYDDDFRVVAQLVNGGSAAPFGYDADGLLTQAGAETLARDPLNGLLTGTALGSVSTSQSYNGFGELAADSASAGGALYANSYTRDKLGRITRKVETIEGVTTPFDYGYDLAGRLVQVDVNGTPARVYAYDANGNRLSVTDSNGVTSGIYDAQDRLLTYGAATYTYNAAGDLTSKTDSSGTTQYSYDALGNLIQVNLPDGRLITYVINGQNRRIGKKINGVLVQAWLYQDQLEPVAELDGSGNVVARFVYGSRPNIPDYAVIGGATYRIVSDHLGSPRLIVNASTGAVVQRLDYDEFGRVTADTNPGLQPFGFAGGLYDADTKLVRFGARDYDAETGSWTAKDPIRFSGSESNLLQYASSDPVNGSDSSGLGWDPWYKGGGFIASGTPSNGWVGDGPGDVPRSSKADGAVPPPGTDVDFIRNSDGSWSKVAGPVVPASDADLDWLKRQYPDLFPPGECAEANSSSGTRSSTPGRP